MQGSSDPVVVHNILLNENSCGTLGVGQGKYYKMENVVNISMTRIEIRVFVAD